MKVFNLKLYSKILYRLLLYSKYFIMMTLINQKKINRLFNQKPLNSINKSIFMSFVSKIEQSNISQFFLDKELNIYQNNYSYFQKYTKKESFIRQPESKKLLNINHWCKYNIEKINKTEDIKNLWEINRLHFIDTAIFSFFIHNDKKILDKVYVDLTQWKEDNPFDYSINWYSNMEVAIRLMKFAFLFSITEDKEQKQKVLQMIKEHYVHLKSGIQFTKYSMGGNHYFIELLVLSAIETIFQIGDYQKNQKLLKDEVEKQFLDDGSHFEGSTGYLIYLFNALLSYILLLKMYNREYLLNDGTIKNIYSFIKSLDYNNELVNYGDWDDGKLFTFNHTNPTNIIDIKIMYSLFFESKVSEHLITHHLNAQCSVYDFNNSKLIFKYSDVQHGHTHLDMLSLYLYNNKTQVIFDGGTFAYNNTKDKRNFYRSIQAHSTIIIPEQYLPIMRGRTFSWNNTLKTNYEIINDQVYGYYKLNTGDIVSRKIVQKKDKYLIEDMMPMNISAYIQYIVVNNKVKIHTNYYIFYISSFVTIVIPKEFIKIYKFEKFEKSNIYNEVEECFSLKLFPKSSCISYHIKIDHPSRQ